MVPLFIFKTDNTTCEDKNFFDGCVLEHYDSEKFILKNRQKILEAYLYYEAIQEMLIGKAVSLWKKPIHNPIKISSLKEIQKEIEQFQIFLIIVVFKYIFNECVEIKKDDGASDIPDALDNLWFIINNSDSDDNLYIARNDVSSLKAYFDSLILDELEKEMPIKWKSIIEEYKRYEEIK